MGGSQNEPRRAMGRTSTGDWPKKPGVLSQGSGKPWGPGTVYVCVWGGSINRWELCCGLGGRDGGAGWGSKGISSVSFFCLFPNLLPLYHLRLPVWGPHPQPPCWVPGLPARYTTHPPTHPPRGRGKRTKARREKSIACSSDASQAKPGPRVS